MLSDKGIVISLLFTLFFCTMSYGEESTFNLTIPKPHQQTNVEIKAIRDLDNQANYHRARRDLAFNVYRQSQDRASRKYWLKKAIEEEAHITLLNILSTDIFLQRDMQILENLESREKNWQASNYDKHLAGAELLLLATTDLLAGDHPNEFSQTDISNTKNILMQLQAHYKLTQDQISRLRRERETVHKSIQEMRTKYTNLTAALDSKQFWEKI